MADSPPRQDAVNTAPGTSEENGARKDEAQDAVKQPSKIKQLWAKLELDLPTFLVMVKGSLPPTIAIAMYQAKPVAHQYQTLGYLVAITSILGFCIMPRGKFLQTITVNILGSCLGAACNLLALYCAIEARRHTTAPGASPIAYNSSASAVCAIFLIVQLYAVNALRASRPQFQFPAIVYCIFTSVSMTYGVLFPSMTYAIQFERRLLETFLTGFALATGVSLFFLPTSSRMVVLKEMAGYLNSFNGILKAQTAYMESLQDIDPVANREKHEKEVAALSAKKRSKLPPFNPLETPASRQLKAALAQAVALHTKLFADITPAKREFAWGKLESHDLSELWKLLRRAFIPIGGLSASIDLIQRRGDDLKWSLKDELVEPDRSVQEHVDRLHFLMKNLSKPFAEFTRDIELGIQHALITLELVKAPKKQDVESAGQQPAPGSAGFAAWYTEKVNGFHKDQDKTLEKWCKENGIQLPPDFFEATFVRPESWNCLDEDRREKNQRSLFFTLYLEYLLWRASVSILDVILFADKRKQEGAFKHSKLIFPGSKTLYKWLKATFGNEDHSSDSHFVGEMDAGTSDALHLGANFSKRRDPEHLAPRNKLERAGDRIRQIPRFFRSAESAFGGRVAAATMTIAIVCYLRDSQQFFLKERLLWAMIMVAISMTRTAGQSTFTFVLRILGTLIATIGSYIVWYIVDGHTPGVIVFLWLWLLIGFYFVLKTPKLIIVAILSMVTVVLIIGYELQTKIIGKKAAESNGQPAYPTYLLAPYRLATVAGGLLVAYIWTIFPYPVSESSELRRDLANTLYLTSNFYSIIHETVKSRVTTTDGDDRIKGTHAYNLDKARNQVFSKLVLLIQNLRANAQFSKLQLRVGGKFPQKEYESLIEGCSRIVQYTALIGYASASFSTYPSSSSLNSTSHTPSQWSADFRKLISTVSNTSHEITSLLALLSSSLSSGQPLPPYLKMRQPFQIVQDLDAIDRDLLSIRHIAEPEYGAFAVIQICAMSINRDIEELTRLVKGLVGEMDFSFHAVSSTESVASESTGTQEVRAKNE